MRRIGSPVVLCLVWLVWSASSAAFGSAASTWGISGRMIEAWRVAGDVPDVCGMAVYRLTDVPFASHALFSRNAPIYQYGPDEQLAGERSRAFNVAMTREALGGELRDFRLVSCDRLHYYCVFRRAAACVRTAADAIHDGNAFLIRQGK